MISRRLINTGIVAIMTAATPGRHLLFRPEEQTVVHHKDQHGQKGRRGPFAPVGTGVRLPSIQTKRMSPAARKRVPANRKGGNFSHAHANCQER